MTLNREVFFNDPVASRLPNDGVAVVARPSDAAGWESLAFELRTFVCSGTYQAGLERILDSYLRNYGKETQPAVWVSGFYGSGKSHLVRVLQFLWSNLTIETTGIAAREMVDLPPSIQAALKELDTLGSRSGGRFAAAGKLSAGAEGSFRLQFLRVVLEAAGLPGDYPQARLVLYLAKNGLLGATVGALAERGKDLSVLTDMYVSPVLHDALAAAGFAGGRGEAAEMVRAQYPAVGDIGDDALRVVLADALAHVSTTPGELPCTLVVLDELQQFIGDDGKLALAVQQLVEFVRSEFGSRIMVVATGQSALAADGVLAKFKDRFTVTVQLSDGDIGEVIRSVVLRKKDSDKALIASLLESRSGEIARHLRGSRVEATPADQEVLVADYPILPTRRRLWERVLQAIDHGRGGALLRSQLRTSLEAARHVGDSPLGHVVGADFLYDDQVASWLNKDVILREQANRIQDLRANPSDDAQLAARICAVVFLVSQLPTGPGAIGVRPTAETIADLLVCDLTTDSATFRGSVNAALDDLVADATLQHVDDEYRLQTKESQEWEQAYRQAEVATRGDDVLLAEKRSAALKTAVEVALGNVSVVQGDTKQARRAVLHVAEAAPPGTSESIVIWVRDGWATTENAVRAFAAAEGTSSSLIHCFLAKRDWDDLRSALAAGEAARRVLDAKPAPTTDDAREARKSIERRQQRATENIQRITKDIVDSAVVLLGGGSEPDGMSTRDRALAAADAAAERLYPRFHDSDHPGWVTVARRAKEGNAAGALKAVDYTGDDTKQPVLAAVLAQLQKASSMKGSDVLRLFAGPPYGWGPEPVRAALRVLAGGGHLSTSINGQPTAPTTITDQQIGTTAFKATTGPVPTTTQRIAVAGLATALGLGKVDARSVETAIPQLLEAIRRLAAGAGGDAPAPPAPNAGLDDLVAMAPNAQIIELAGTASGWKNRTETWRATAEKLATRTGVWRTTERLARHADAAGVSADACYALAGVRDVRALLDDPDPVPTLRTALHGDLAAAVTGLVEQIAGRAAAARQQLEADPDWHRISPADQAGLLAPFVDSPAPPLSTVDQLLAALDATPISVLRERLDATDGRLQQQLTKLRQLAEPKAKLVTLPRRTLRSSSDVDAYLEELKAMLQVGIAAGPVALQ